MGGRWVQDLVRFRQRAAVGSGKVKGFGRFSVRKPVMPESAWAPGRGLEVGVRDVEHGFRAAERPANAGRRGPGGGDGRRGEHDGRYGSRFRAKPVRPLDVLRSEEHTSELQSLMRNSY